MTADDSTHRRRAKSLHERQIALHGRAEFRVSQRPTYAPKQTVIV
jgi:hypothetical protein